MRNAEKAYRKGLHYLRIVLAHYFVVVVVVVLLLTISHGHITMRSVVARQAPITLKLKNI